jgi:hypothetical protein
VFEQPRRALDVAEEERDRTTGLGRHRDNYCALRRPLEGLLPCPALV